MHAFILSLLGLSFLGVLVDVVISKNGLGVDFIFELIVLLVVVSNIFSLFKQWSFL